MSALSVRYTQTAWASRGIAAVVLAAVGASLMHVEGYSALLGAAVGVGIVLATHALLTWSHWLKIGVVLAVQTVVITWISLMLATIAPHASAALSGTTLVLIVGTLVIAGVTRYAHGRSWLTISLALLVTDAATVLLANWWNAYAALAGLGLGVCVVVLRIVFPRKRVAYEAGDTSALVKRLGNYSTRVIGDAILLGDRKGHVAVVHSVSLPAALTVDEKRGSLTSAGVDVSAVLAAAARQTDRIARGALTIVAIEGLSTTYMPVALVSKAGRDKGVVAVVSARRIADGVDAYFADAQPQPWSIDAIKALRMRINNRDGGR